MVFKSQKNEVPPGKATILVVDDDEGLLALMRSCLERAGFKTSGTGTGKEALAWLDVNDADLMLLDYQLPDLTGKDMLGRLAKRKQTIPFVTVSGQGDEQIVVEMMKSGALDYVVKDDALLTLLPSVVAIAIGRYQQQKKLAEAEEEIISLAKFVSENPNPVLRISGDGGILCCNKASSPLLGFWGCQQGQLLPEKWRTFVRETLDSMGPQETEIQCGNRIFSLTFAPVEDCGYVNIYAHDITGRKAVESRQVFARRILEQISRKRDMQGLINDVLASVKEFTAFDAVALRLNEGCDFPYLAAKGFSEDFVRSENNICCYDKQGQPVCDSQGKVVLECVCGNVISGRSNANTPFYTSGGSFWTNCASRVPSLVNEDFASGRMRGRCVQAGYESVALIPLRSESGIIGLMQLCDSSADRLTLEMVHFLEGIAASIGIGIAKKKVEEQLRQAHNELEMTVRQRTAELRSTVAELQVEVTQRAKAEKKILADQQQLRKMAAELLLTEERERRQIAVALHDSIGQILAFSSIELSNLLKTAPREQTDRLNNVHRLVEQAISETRSLTCDLSPAVLYTFGLDAAMEQLAEQFSSEHSILCSFKTCIEPQTVSKEIQILLFRAVRELLVNIVKHAEARKTKITLSRVDYNIRIVVEDDGKGFDLFSINAVRGRSDGLGLFSIRERLTHLGGSIAINSHPGRGTRITLLAPLEPMNKRAKEIS